MPTSCIESPGRLCISTHTFSFWLLLMGQFQRGTNYSATDCLSKKKQQKHKEATEILLLKQENFHKYWEKCPKCKTAQKLYRQQQDEDRYDKSMIKLNVVQILFGLEFAALPIEIALGLNVFVITSVTTELDLKCLISLSNNIWLQRQMSKTMCFNKTARQRSIITDNVLMLYLIKITRF